MAALDLRDTTGDRSSGGLPKDLTCACVLRGTCLPVAQGPEFLNCSARAGRPVLKITRCALTGYENSPLYIILQSLTRNGF